MARLFTRGHVVGTYAVVGLVALANVLVFRLAAAAFGPTGFADYALIRRVFAMLSPLVLLGTTVTLPRELARAEPGQVVRIATGGLALTILCVGAAGIAMWPSPSVAAGILFGARDRQELVMPAFALLAGYSLHSVAYSTYRGTLHVAAANGLHLMSQALLPLIAFAAPAHSAGGVLLLTGLGVAVGGVVALVRFFGGKPWTVDRRWIAVLARQGWPRMLGEAGLAALVGVPTLLVAHWSSARDAGYIAFATTMLSVVGMGFAPLNMLLLPAISRAIADGSGAHVWPGVKRQVIGLVLGTAGIVVIGQVAMTRLLSVVIGISDPELVTIMRVVLLALLPFSLFVVARSLIDAADERALNARNILAALGVLVGAGALLVTVLRPTHAVAVALVAGMVVLGAGTLRDLTRTIRKLERLPSAENTV